MISAIKSNSLLRALAILALLFVCATPPPLAAAQQGGTVRYVYDNNGRLIRVIAPNGDTVVYEYDAAGNFTSIRRVTSEILALFDFMPKVGGPGDRVTFSGSGFGAGIDQVSFNGTAGRLISSSATTVVAEVPEGATTGPVTIVTPRGRVTSSEPFTIKSVRVQPATATIAPGASIQFTAAVLVQGDPSVKWSVNGVEGGNAASGTITTAGLYTAPSLPLFPILVRATSAVDTQLFGEAQLVVRSLDADIAATSNAVLVALAPTPAPPASLSGVSASVSVLRDPPPAARLPIAAISAGLSVKRGDNLDPTTTIAALSSGISIQRAPAQSVAQPTAAISAAVSATKGPTVSSVSPNQIARGAAVSVTISGANLNDTAVFRFINIAGAIDTNVVASNLVVTANGTLLTLTINVSASATLGRHLVIVSTAGGSSSLFDTGSNIIEITP